MKVRAQWSAFNNHASAENSRNSDQALIARVARGDSSALEMLYDRHAPAALALATRIVGERALGEEVVQESFFRVWKSAGSYRTQRGQFSAWLYSIVHHLAIDELRKRNVRPGLLPSNPDNQVLLEIPDSREDVAGTVLTRLAGEQLRRAMARLPDAQRHVLELAYFEGLTHREISQKLGEPLGTVHTRTRLGLCKLREQLEPLGAA